jgi:hypothetical protein
MNGVGCESHENTLLALGRGGFSVAGIWLLRAIVGGASAESADACCLRQIFRESKLAQDRGGVNAMGLRYPEKGARMKHSTQDLAMIAG